MPLMREVAIIGAGELGGLLAHALARRDVARHVRLIDETGRVAEGKALDIAQAGPVEAFATRVSGSAELSDAAGASVIALADRAAGGERSIDEQLLLLKQIVRLAPNTIVMCAGASERELVERGVRELGRPARGLFGSAPEALAAAVRAMVALEANGSPADVALALAGIPPSHVMIPWEDATIAGFAATRTLDEPARRRIQSRTAALWPPGPHALAMAATKAIDAIAGRSRKLVSCFVGPDDSGGRRTRAAALPVRLGPYGIAEMTMPRLDPRDRVALENATLL